MRLRLASLLPDIVLAACLSGVAYLITHFLLLAVISAPFSGGGGVSLLLFVLTAFIYPFVPFTGPVLVALIGLIKRRAGIVVGALVFATALPLVSILGVVLAREEARRADIRDFKPLEGAPQVIVIADEGFCGPVCIQVLAATDYAVAGERSDVKTGWILWRRLAGADCLQPQNVESHLAFLRAGYVDLCAARGEWIPTGDAIVVVRSDSHNGAAQKIVGPRYRGAAFEAYERRDGQDRLLGRWIAGHIEQPLLPIVRYSRRELEVGRRFQPAEFYASLLGSKLIPGDVTGQASADQLFAALAVLLKDGGNSREVQRLSIDIARRSRETDLASVLRWIERLVSDPDRSHITTGLWMITAVSQSRGLKFAEPAILEALESNDAEVVEAALAAVASFPRDERDFADQAIVALAFGPVVREADDRLLQSLLSHLRDRAPFGTDVRAKARNRFFSPELPTLNEAGTLMMVYCHGQSGSRAALSDLVQSLQGESFETAVEAVSRLGWSGMDCGGENRWSDAELALFVARAGDVPNERFKAYVDAFRFQGSEQVKQDLVAEVERRLKVLSGSPSVDGKLLKMFEGLRLAIPRNRVN